jgi:hypothetical protein
MANLTQITPASGQLAGGDRVTLTGTGFVGVSGVNFAGTAATNVTVVSTTSITCTTPPGSGPGVVDVAVSASSGSTHLAGFEYLIPAPTLTMIMPNTGLEAGGTSVSLTGADWTGATRVTFGGTVASNLNVVSDTSITCVTPAGTATVDVTVETPNGNATLIGGYGYIAPPSGPEPDCVLCKYFDPLPATQPPVPGQRRTTVMVQAGYCRHNPPVVATGPGNRGASGWPICQAGDWCGEFEYVKADS